MLFFVFFFDKKRQKMTKYFVLIYKGDIVVYFVFNISILLLPISFYLISISYKNSIKKINNEYFLSFILIIQVLFYIILNNYTKSLILINISLLISYLKRKEITSIILSILIVYYYVVIVKFNIYFIFFEYVLYYVIYLIINRKTIRPVSLIYIFVFAKSIILSIEIFYFNKSTNPFILDFIFICIKMLVFYISSYLVFIFLLRGEQIMNLNTAIKELEKEKVLRTSLFKIVHEIKNPIAVCKGYLDMLDLDNKIKINKYIPIIKSEIERTLALMDDYLDYTKVNINVEEVDIYLLIEEVIEAMEYFFLENNIKLIVNIPKDELYLRADFNRIKQVLVNILKNSHEAIDKNKKEMIIKIYTEKTEKNFNIIIEDNGIGMDEETVNKISELFFTTKKNGTGLGISLSKEIIELHGGKLNYYSKIGVGTKVKISLPY